MKKITVLLLLILPAITGFSQAKLVNAINYLKDFEKNNKEQESLTKAKESIDSYLQGEKIKDVAKAQKVKGQVYLTVFENNLNTETEKLSNIADATEKILTAYSHTATTELDIASEAFKAAKAADAKGAYLLDIMKYTTQIIGHYFNKANADYNQREFAGSMKNFEKAYELDEGKDTNLLNNIALTALHSQNYEKAKQSYTAMAEAKQGGANTYGNLVETYFLLKDTVGGMGALKKGRAVYPGDANLLNLETNYYLRSGKSEEALKNLDIAITANQKQPELFLARGYIYEKLAKPEDTDGKSAVKPKNYLNLYNSAESDYKKAVELSEGAFKSNAKNEAKEVYFNSLYQLGALYFNEGVEVSKQADKITDNAKFAVENKKAIAFFEKAIPYLEKSIELKNDEQALYALKQLYTRMNLSDKVKEINERLKN